MSDFGVTDLRTSVLQAWRGSPTRFREDANAEEDLRLGGYRDRLLVELAQNAADAAGSGGVLRLSVVDGELRAANTGAPLTEAGVAALASLRASAKRGTGTIGQFGVGFAAVLAVTDEPRVVSTTGGVAFSAARTRELVGDLPEVAERDGAVPVLRLAWPVPDDEPPVPEGFDTEVRLPLRPEVDAAELLAECAAETPDLLLALPGLSRIEVGEHAWWREDNEDGTVVLHGPTGRVRWLLRRASGELDAAVVEGLGVEARQRSEWSVCWAVPIDDEDVPRPLDEDVLHAPTPTDERLSLPARLLATIPVEASRRRLMPGAATDAVLAEAARAYSELVLAVRPEHRTLLVPLPDFPKSEVDGQLRALVTSELRTSVWLPLQEGGFGTPARSRVLDVLAPELADMLADIVGGLAKAELSGTAHARQLAALEVPRLRLSEIVAIVSGQDRDPAWWARLYAALDPVAEQDSTAREELGGLPVPLIDGRTVTGPRDVLLPDFDQETLAELSTMDVTGLRVAHPDAVHRLLERLGARSAGPADLLDAMRTAVERSMDDAESGVDTTSLVDFVLWLTESTGARRGERPWLGTLALPDADGEFRHADELILPSSPLREVFAEDMIGKDAPLGVLADELASRWTPDVLAAVGVIDSFVVVFDDSPGGPDHELADEEAWWTAVDGDLDPPSTFAGVRDLDLVADDKWPAALRLLAAEPETWQAILRPGGYTSWWLARHARLAGASPRSWRLPDADALAGVYDPIPDVGVRTDLLAAIGVRASLVVTDAADVTDVLQRLGDSTRAVPPGVAMRAHGALAEAVRSGAVEAGDVELDEHVRALSGASVSGEQVVVLDSPWLLAAFAPDQVVAADPDDAEPLAELLDLPLAADEVDADALIGDGQPVSWSDLGAVVAASELLDRPVPDGLVVVYDELSVRRGDTRYRVAWWVTEDGVVHAEDTPAGLSRALAWAVDRWHDRHLLAALLDDPTAATYLS
ncbi:sacsin N-terminal ATP-binding-like domain-containing protein [Kutzneria sp. CA-103260]|uniref:sacsin N-terminal ATP-binding-like domain-containing protein n=1 Tax=Kutzneria sp. CA-103260 TaxID=2802641 RepID=UPI001BAC89BF|nr:hypothetical protein [Kutzneria sp. CA-103260]QUQ69462.1 HSP90 family heat shock protein [Kutzneria sp. CA-103260]